MSDELVALPGGELSVADRLAAMDLAAQQYLDSQVRRATRRAYDQDVRVWGEYCAELRIPPTALSLGPVVGFVEWLFQIRQAPPSTVDRRLRGVANRFGIDPEVMKAARAALSGWRVSLAEAGVTRGRGKAQPVTPAELRALYHACDGTRLIGLRDRAMFTLGFAIGARSEDPAHMLVTDVERVERGLLVAVRWSKTGSRVAKVIHGEHVDSCPVRAWDAWMEAYGALEGPAFPRINRHGHILGSISPQSVGLRMKEMSARAGLGHRTWHGIRSGMATAARAARKDALSIAAQGGWAPNSSSMLGYMHLVDGWGDDNALRGIGT